MKIFVQIASYRDPLLESTIESLLSTAKHPENLVLGIARQFHPNDNFGILDKWKGDTRFKILDIPYNETEGVCWARNLVQQLYNGEEYTMQIDSHMRFEKDWDIKFIEMITNLQQDGYPKPLLTGYVSSFDPDDDPHLRAKDPWLMTFDRFIPEGAVFFIPSVIPNWQELTRPVPSRYYSAHFCFTVGEFSIEVQHNPEYYFHGEEISIAARAYTFGYDLFHPHIPLVYHEYTRKNRTKQWDDDSTWSEKNKKSHLINRQLFGMDDLPQEGHDGVYGFGSVRTLRDYEKYAGILFSKRAIQKETLDNKYPPNTYNYKTEEDWLNSFSRVFKHCIDVSFSSVPEKDYDFWVVAFHDGNNETIHRADADANEISRMLNDPDGYCKLWREFNATSQPKYWVVWPHSTSKGWCERLTGELI
jgi:hypothetical protein